MTKSVVFITKQGIFIKCLVFRILKDYSESDLIWLRPQLCQDS